MIKHAILIGINSIPELPYLSSPSTYAIKMKNWAQSQGYKTHLFADEAGDEHVSGRCRRTDILDVCRDIVDDGCDQLLIYFAGHGVELTAGDDIWLLPGYVDDGADCISILACQQYAYRTGIKHVVFISDACRSPSDNPLIRPVRPSSMLPNRNNTNHRTVVDIFYSTWPGENSRDIKSEDTGNYHSLYSDSLLDCLHGTVPQVIKKIENITPNFPAVLSFELNNYLKNEVPKKFRLAGSKVQYPTGTVSSCDPLFLSKFPVDGAEEANIETALSTIVETNFRRIESKTIDQKLDSYLKTKNRTVNLHTKKIIQDFIRNYKLFTSAALFTTESTALYVTGYDNPTVFSSREKDWHGIQEDWWSERRQRDFSSIETLDFSDIGQRGVGLYFVANWQRTRFYPIYVLYGFLAQVVFEKDELLTVNYFPTQGYNKEGAYKYALEIAERKAQIILAARNGMFQGTRELADYLRTYKLYDPTLGLFAAYAYFQKGDFDGVDDVYNIIASDEHQSMLGDIWMLKKLSSSLSIPQDEILLPIVTEGWSYLNMLDENPFLHLSKYLLPGLWTSFSKDGMSEIIHSFNLKEI